MHFMLATCACLVLCYHTSDSVRHRRTGRRDVWSCRMSKSRRCTSLSFLGVCATFAPDEDFERNCYTFTSETMQRGDFQVIRWQPASGRLSGLAFLHAADPRGGALLAQVCRKGREVAQEYSLCNVSARYIYVEVASRTHSRLRPCR